LKLAAVLSVLLIVVLSYPQDSRGQATRSSAKPEPIIDVHLHAVPVDSEGPPPLFICAPYDYWPAWDTRIDHGDYEASVDQHPPCAHPLKTPGSDVELMQQTLAIMEARNIIGVASGGPASVEKWKQAGKERILPAVYFNPLSGKPSVAELRKLSQTTHIVAFAEISTQYMGLAPNDPKLEPYYALAEELDIPVGIHIGPGPPGVPYFGGGTPYRMRDSSMLLLEDVLTRHPKMRLWAMHAGWPLGDDAVAALYAHPQLYVDTGIIDYAFPHKEFYAYLQRLIDAGFENRIMFGSDEMVWPDALSAAIDTVNADPALTQQQKRDIFYNNAARFLRLDPPAKR
jgi:predicted TIM-barrel fold metal-dependent hydrolase